MNLRDIIRESIKSVLLDDIISEEILHEASRATRRRYNNNRQQPRKTQNLQQRRQQNSRQANNTRQQTQQQQPANQQVTATIPNQNQENTQGGYGYDNSDFDDAGHNAPNTQQPQNTQPQNQQQPAVDFNQYADELRRLVGNYGIDTKPVENSQDATEFIGRFNHFVFDVISAIDTGNIYATNSAARSDNSVNRWGKLYSKDAVDMAMDASKGIVGFASNNAEKVLGYGANNPFNGVFRAFGDAHNQDMNYLGNYMNQKKYSDSYNQPSQGVPSDSSLTELMTNYPNLYREYQQINQSNNGIFNATPNVSQCCVVLNSLYQTIGSQQTAQNTKQPAQQKNTQQVTIQLEKFINNIKRLDGNGTALGNEYVRYEGIAEVAEFIEHVGDLSEMCVRAMDNKIIYSHDYKGDGVYSLTELMGLGGVIPVMTYLQLCGYYNGNKIKNKLPENAVTNEIFKTLTNMYRYMQTNRINN